MTQLAVGLRASDPIESFISNRPSFAASTYQSGVGMLTDDFHKALLAYASGTGSLDQMVDVLSLVAIRPLRAGEMEKVIGRLASADPVLRHAFGEEGPLTLEIVARQIVDQLNAKRFGATAIATLDPED